MANTPEPSKQVVHNGFIRDTCRISSLKVRPARAIAMNRQASTFSNVQSALGIGCSHVSFVLTIHL